MDTSPREGPDRARACTETNQGVLKPGHLTGLVEM